MNETAEQHVVKAREYLARGEEFYRQALARGEEFYRQAAAEIEAARQAGATFVEIADAFGRSESWVQKLVAWAKLPANEASSFATPFGGQAPAINLRKTKQLLREAPLEEVERIVADLPPEAAAKVAHAANRVVSKAAADRVRRSDEAFADAVGDETVAALAGEQKLRDAEAQAFAARQALRTMLSLLNDSDLEGMRESWREDFLKTLDDLSMRLAVARSLFEGVRDDDLERFLTEV